MAHRHDARALVVPIVIAAVAGLSGWSNIARAQSGASSFVFEVIASFGDPVPGGGQLTDYFQLGGLNNQGTLALAAGVASDNPAAFGEAVLLMQRGRTSLVARSQQAAPGGFVFGGGTLFPIALNNEGDLVFSFGLEPFQVPIESSAGLFLYSHNSTQLSAPVLPNGSAGFSGVGFGPALNSHGSVAFSGLVPATIGPGSDVGVGSGVFVRDRAGNFKTIAQPGDESPGGSVFDWTAYPSINDGGDVTFAGHRVDQPACPPPSPDLFCFVTGVYLADRSTDALTVVAAPGDPAPGDGDFTLAMFGRVNARRDVAFLARTSLHPSQFSAFVQVGAELHRVAVVGDPAPGGGHFVRLGPGSTGTNPLHINDTGVVSFLALLDTDVDADGRADTGAFQWRDGVVTAIARTGTIVDGVGTVRDVRRNDIVGNERGDAAFWVRLADGRELVLVATAHP
jgi:hypothetical protein